MTRNLRGLALLPSETIRDFPPNFSSKQMHAGLYFNKYANAWQWENEAKSDSKLSFNKSDWLKSFVSQCNPVGHKQALETYTQRIEHLVAARGGMTLRLKTVERFVTGLGLPHPVENGFLWHHSLGVPYLPGTAVKGILRAQLEADTESQIDDETFLRLFGSPRRTDSAARENDTAGKAAETATAETENEKDTASMQRGALLCFDAPPTIPVRLELDIMTPHYGPYYHAGDIPGDWHSPNPVTFLTVAPETEFIFSFAPYKSTGIDIELEELSRVLRIALDYFGAGAKTAAGYGRFL
ncbi:type III-B CRISPR module RAMP protein Cmr6 [Pelagibius sp. Alg239-R121]|uniref:type III-B CRISPR module RAMP protein Cmr6 n=1 Tax=Pelagibius sp. Alg239-R121 TaxID=2993448 RepID=UPI0024A6D158|nr:type III-B CRISPR module RAMP protein Cmr6 [Pelagibius sp. Alg239-R121]